MALESHTYLSACPGCRPPANPMHLTPLPAPYPPKEVTACPTRASTPWILMMPRGGCLKMGSWVARGGGLLRVHMGPRWRRQPLQSDVTMQREAFIPGLLSRCGSCGNAEASASSPAKDCFSPT